MEKRENISHRSRLRIGQVAVAALLVVTLGALAWAGGDPWKTKPFDQWTQNDVRQILGDSPWAQVQFVPAEWTTKSGMEGAPSVSDATNAPVYTPNTNVGQTGQQPVGTPPGRAAYSVRWSSSRTVREALVRDAILNGQVKEADAPKYLSAPISDYEIAVLGPDMTPFGGVSDTEFKSKSYLRGKQSKVQVNPTKVEMMRSPNGSQLMAVVFTFPRKTADGKDIAAPQEKGLQFVCKIKNLDLSATFDPRKMADSKGPDF